MRPRTRDTFRGERESKRDHYKFITGAPQNILSWFCFSRKDDIYGLCSLSSCCTTYTPDAAITDSKCAVLWFPFSHTHTRMRIARSQFLCARRFAAKTAKFHLADEFLFLGPWRNFGRKELLPPTGSPGPKAKPNTCGWNGSTVLATFAFIVCWVLRRLISASPQSKKSK